MKSLLLATATLLLASCGPDRTATRTVYVDQNGREVPAGMGELAYTVPTTSQH